MLHIIAEAGSNYNGSVDYAKRLIDVAKTAGADSVKFQIINPDGLYRGGDYAYGPYEISEIRKIRCRDVLSDGAWHEIFNYSRLRKLPCSASVFDEKGADLLANLDPPYIKLSSSDLTNHFFIEQVLRLGFKTILSTGMSSLAEVEGAMNFIARKNFSSNNIVLLHCVSVYPADVRTINLPFLTELQAFGVETGFSDHTVGNVAGCAAVALGASWIEKHFTFDNSLDGLDHEHSASPAELEDYIKALRETEAACTRQEQKLSEKELNTAERARRGLYYSRDLKRGQTLSPSDIKIVRPSTNLSANQIYEFLGKTLVVDVSCDQPLTTDDVRR